jgi:hypothetical protein
MKNSNKSYLVALVLGVFFSYFIWINSTKNNVIIEDPAYLFSQISIVESQIKELESLPEIPKLSNSWDLLNSVSEVSSVKLTYLPEKTLGNIPLYNGYHLAWHGTLAGNIEDVLAVSYYISNKIPVYFYQFTAVDGEANLYISVLGVQ